MAGVAGRVALARLKGDAIAAAKLQGCICKVEVADIRWRAGVPDVALAHDDWCPLLKAVSEPPPGMQRSIDRAREKGWRQV